MEIVKAKKAGFCFGVKRAVDKVYEILDSGCEEVYSIGPIIHNELVTNDLISKGLCEVNDKDCIVKLKNKKVIIRTHGIEKEVLDILRENNNEIIDLTCPFVKKIHNLVSDYSKKGYNIIVIGDKNHPEVKGIVSYCTNRIDVIIDENDIKNIDYKANDKVLVVFQTTTNSINGQKLVDILSNLFYNIMVVNTICNATEDRQKEVSEMSKVCDVMLIVGSKNSSNTKKLFEISKVCCENTYLISDKNELLNINIKNALRVGVSAGASTPEYLIEEILLNARNEF